MPVPAMARLAVAASAKSTLAEESLIHSTKVGAAAAGAGKRWQGGHRMGRARGSGA